jgi:hypothetical protein
MSLDEEVYEGMARDAMRYPRLGQFEKEKIMETEKQTATQTTTNTEITQVRQEELIKFIKLENQIKALEAEKDTLSEDLKRLLMAGATVEDGVHRAEAKLSERRSPRWKEEAIALADKLKGAGKGEEWAAKIVENTEPTQSVTLKIR